jgi:hypothetical protein
MRVTASTNKRASRFRRAECPRCLRLVFCRVSAAQFDSLGFESYVVDCGFCRTSLTGMIDPQDDLLLLTAHAPCDDTGSGAVVLVD